MDALIGIKQNVRPILAIPSGQKLLVCHSSDARERVRQICQDSLLTHFQHFNAMYETNCY